MRCKDRLIGALEAGGTKFNCAIGTSEGDLLQRTRINTTTPEKTLEEVVNFFRTHGPIEALGIGCFGPLDLEASSPTYGHITSTPKLAWQHTPILRHLQEALNVPCALDTDVNAAALGEQRWGAAQGANHVLYLTIGTGIGGGAVLGGHLLHGLMHPEMGHIMLPRDASLPAGVCPFHGNCLEGLISGPALQKRWGAPAQTLPPDHPCWDEFAELLGTAIATFAYTLSPHKVVLGGGVMQQQHLLPKVHAQVSRTLAQYLPHPPMEEWICLPGLGEDSGLKGALALAIEAIAQR